MARLRSVIAFQVHPGREAEFEAAFEAARMLSRPNQVDGFTGAELIRCLDEPTHYMVLGGWSSEAAYREWQGRSIQDAPVEALQRLFATLTDPSPGRIFSVVASSH
ncbi:MAG: antibiotic biosynthesis monooxygenase [bacterium]|nr:antibiotic biosynthesis monooxygenase [bacterium]